MLRFKLFWVAIFVSLFPIFLPFMSLGIQDFLPPSPVLDLVSSWVILLSLHSISGF